ncbi:MAG: hypothetical protein M1816_001054 [Peltula sp. TS41687]|nr:MAG: hypothetical protein M1816_001054 [Peltula sp. TS41687]
MSSSYDKPPMTPRKPRYGTDEDPTGVEEKIDALSKAGRFKPCLLHIPNGPEFILTDEQYRLWTEGTFWTRPGEEYLQYMTTFRPDPNDSILAAIEDWDYPYSPRKKAVIKPKNKITFDQYCARKKASREEGGDGTTPLGSVPMSTSTSSQSIFSDTIPKDPKDVPASVKGVVSEDRLNAILQKAHKPDSDAGDWFLPKNGVYPVSTGKPVIKSAAKNIMDSVMKDVKPAGDMPAKKVVNTTSKKDTTDGGKLNGLSNEAHKTSKEATNMTKNLEKPMAKDIVKPAAKNASHPLPPGWRVCSDEEWNSWNNTSAKEKKPVAEDTAKPAAKNGADKGAFQSGQGLNNWKDMSVQDKKPVAKDAANPAAKNVVDKGKDQSVKKENKSKPGLAKPIFAKSAKDVAQDERKVMPAKGNKNKPPIFATSAKDVTKGPTKPTKNDVSRFKKLGRQLAPTIPAAAQTMIEQFHHSNPPSRIATPTVPAAQTKIEQFHKANPPSKIPTASGQPYSFSKPGQPQVKVAEKTGTVAGKAPKKGPTVESKDQKEGLKSTHESKSTQHAHQKDNGTKTELKQAKDGSRKTSEQDIPDGPFILKYGKHNAAGVKKILKEKPATVKKTEAVGLVKSNEKKSAKTEQTSQAKPEAVKSQAKPEAVKSQAKPAAVKSQAKPEAVKSQAKPKATKTEQTSQAKPKTDQVKGQVTNKSGKPVDDKKSKTETHKSSEVNGKKQVTSESTKASQKKDPKVGDKRPAEDDQGRPGKKQKLSEETKNTKEKDKVTKDTKKVQETKVVKSGGKRDRSVDDVQPTERPAKKQKTPDQAPAKKGPKAGDKRPREEDVSPEPVVSKKQKKQTEQPEPALKKKKAPTPPGAVSSKKPSSGFTTKANKDNIKSGAATPSNAAASKKPSSGFTTKANKDSIKSGAATPSNAVGNAVGSKKPTPGLTNAANKDNKTGAAMKKTSSSESHVATPQAVKNDAGTAQAPTSGGNTSRPVSAEGSVDVSSMSREEVIKVKRREGSEYRILGKQIKVEAEKLLKPVKPGTATSSEGIALGIQSICCYFIAFKADDVFDELHYGRHDKDKRTDRGKMWRTLLPFWEYVEGHSRPFGPLHGICLQLGAVIREVVHGFEPADVENFTHMRRLWVEGTAKLTTNDVLEKTFPKTWAARVKNPLELVTNKTRTGFYLPMASCITAPHEAVRATNALVNEWVATQLGDVKWDDGRLHLDTYKL